MKLFINRQNYLLSCLTRYFCITFILMAGLLFGNQALAGGAPPPPSCMEDVWEAHGNNQSLTCTANDVTLSSVSDVCVHVPNGHPQEDPSRPGCQEADNNGNFSCNAGQDFTFTAEYEMPLNAQARRDLGLYVATDGSSNALRGECANNVLTAENADDLFLSDDRQFPEDICGDINDDHNPQRFIQTITTLCNDSGNGVTLPWCTSWRQPGKDDLCDTTDYDTAAGWDAYPGSPSKCNCGTLTIDVFSETASITVVKTALTAGVPETGGSATYSVAITNNALVSNVEIDTLLDDQYGDIEMTHAAGGGFQAVTSTTCNDNPIVIAAMATYNCMFTGDVPPGDFGSSFDDVVQACGSDDFGHSDLCDDDDATVPYTDVSVDPSLVKMSTGATVRTDVNYSVLVTNNSAHDTLSLTSLTDDIFGSITTVHAAGGGFLEVISTTCGIAVASGGAGVLPHLIATSGSYSCAFVGRHNGTGTFPDRVSGAATDSDGVNFGDNGTTGPLGDDASVTIAVTTDPAP